MVGEKFKAVRKAKSLTLEGAARMLGIKSSGHLSMVERGDREPSDALVNNFKLTFSVSETWWETGEGEMFQAPDSTETAGGPGSVIDGKMFGGSLEDQLAYEEWKKLSKDQKLFVIQILSASQSLSPDQLSQLEHLSRKLKEGS